MSDAIPISATIARLRALAAQSGDAMITEGHVETDHELLDLCAAALQHRRLFDEANADWRENHERRISECQRQGRSFTKLEMGLSNAAMKEADAHEISMKRVLTKARKLRATTAAGIFAKALIVRSSRTGAALLAMSLADDLIACPGLRQSIWPAEVGDQHQIGGE